MMRHARLGGRGRLHPRHRFPRAALWSAGAFALAAVAWSVLGVPAVVKYPTDLDVSPHYEGTFTVLVNPATAAPLAQPLVLPLTVDRRIRSDPERSDSTRVLVHETMHQRAGELLDVIERNDYVMDRSTVANVADSRSYAFEPTNVVDRSGTYRVNLPFGAHADASFDIYKNETATSYRMVPDPSSTVTEIGGLAVSDFRADGQEVPLTEAYKAQLGKASPLPASLTFEQLKPHLAAAGLDVDVLLAALRPTLRAEDALALAAMAARPTALDYVTSFSGTASIEPVTGAEIRVNANETIAARPRPTDLLALKEVLDRYPQVPEAVSASAALDRMANGAAIPLFTYRYDQTPASVAEMVDVATPMRRQVRLAQVWLPVGLAALAAVSLVVGTVVYQRRKPRPLDLSGLVEAGPAPRPAAESRPVTAAGPGRTSTRT